MEPNTRIEPVNPDDKAPRPYVSRAGAKLAAALDAFDLDVRGWVVADLGSQVGGFVDCLLRREAARVYAIDTCYGSLDWTLRNDPRVVVIERTNALHVTLPEPADLVTIDVGWTPQRLILPAADRHRRQSGPIVSLLKPQYEATPRERYRGVVRPECLDGVVARVLGEIAALGLDVRATVPSPIKGGGGMRNFCCGCRRASSTHRCTRKRT